VEGDYPDIDDDYPKNEGYKNLQAQVTYAQARLDTAVDQLEALTSGFDVEEVAIKKRQVESAEKAVAEAQKDLDEVARKLADDINLKEHEVDSARQSVEQSEKSAKLAEKSVKLEEGSAKLAEKSLNQDQKQLDKAVITAPFDGVVASVDAEAGDTITTVNKIIHLIDTSNMELVVELDEIDIPGVRVNQDAVIELDALPEIEIMGKVTSIYPLPRMESGMVLYDVKVNFVVTSEFGVKIGMSASIDIVINERNNVLMVPARAITQDRGGTMVVEVIQNKQVEAITQDKEGNIVVKVVQEEQVEARPVITGIINDVETEIISGLQEGEVVLLKIKARPQSSELEFF
jgi:multidrug efflux pump subunit AcrA (membrane-fusion protein)